MRTPSALAALVVAAASAAAQPGALDPSFGAGGAVLRTVDLFSDLHGYSDLESEEVLIHSDNSITIASVFSGGLGGPIAWDLTRLSEHGHPDRSFGTDGIVHYSDETTSPAAPLSGGRLAISRRGQGVGVLGPVGAWDVFPGGRPSSEPVGFPVISDLVALPSGALLVAGVKHEDQTQACLAAQLTPDGAVDAAFGAGGQTGVVLNARNLPVGAHLHSYCGEVAHLPGGGFVLTAMSAVYRSSTGWYSDLTLTLATFSESGVPIREADVSLPSALCQCDGSPGRPRIAVLPDGSTLVLLKPPSRNGARAIVRFGPDGALDDRYGNGGVAPVPHLPAGAVVHDLAAQPDGRVVVIGTVPDAPGGINTDLFAARLFDDGSLDRSFGTGGYTVVRLPGAQRGENVQVGPQGRIVVVGTEHVPSSSISNVKLLVVRLLGDAAVAAEPDPAARPLSLRVAPHPVRGPATLTLDVAAPGPVRLALYDALGREAARVHDGPLAAGPHRFALPGSLAPGVYVARATGAGLPAALRVVVAGR